ncbi:MAG: LodA/GoxA family CTQ-dependent oxidase [Phycisphaerales bacterium]
MDGLLSRRAFLGRVAITAAAAMVPAALAGRARAGGVSIDASRVARVAIHPAVGVARVGNSRDAFFFGPEVPGQVPAGPFKDAQGAMAKQAARVRIYAYDAHGEVLGEVTAADAEISWSVTVGNGKANWYGDDVAFDVPGAQPTVLRNPDVTDRASIYPVATTRVLRGAAARPRRLTGGVFAGVPIDFGEVLTDADGRLVVLPGEGRAYSAPGAPPLAGYADNAGWIDDTCDGPIRATVTIGGRRLQATPARVVCGSPNYAPGIGSGIITLYDAALSGLYSAGRHAKGRTRFGTDVMPIFARMTDMQWVNDGYLTRYGFGSHREWTRPDMRRRLADPSPANRTFRQGVLKLFRNPDYTVVQPDLEPQMYGDEIMMPPNLTSARQWYALTRLQYAHLRSWAAGAFDVGDGLPAGPVGALDPADQPVALDRAALDACLGGAFHPGVEFPWLARVNWIWTDDLRLRNATTRPDLTDYGPELTAQVAMSRTGPLSRLGPGGYIQWMGTPWHADSSSCRYGYQRVSPQLPTFWPARIPNAVLTADDYRIVVDESRSLAERRRAFRRRMEWERFIAHPTGPPTLAMMVDEWSKLGVVRERPGPRDGAFPAVLKVESDVGFAKEPETIWPAWVTQPQLPAWPLVTANSDDNSIRSIDSRGRVTVLPLKGSIARPEGMGRDRYGNLYVAAMDGGTVQRVGTDLSVSTYASGIPTPVGILFTFRGTLYVSSYTAAGGIYQVPASGSPGWLVAPGAGISQPTLMAMMPDGSALLVSCAATGSVAAVNPSTGQIINPAFISGLTRPRGIAFDAYWNIYVANQGANTINRYSSQGNPLPFALRGDALATPFGLAFDADGSLYVTPTQSNIVQRVAIRGNTGTVSTFASNQANPGGLVFNGNVVPPPGSSPRGVVR